MKIANLKITFFCLIILFPAFTIQFVKASCCMYDYSYDTKQYYRCDVASLNKNACIEKSNETGVINKGLFHFEADKTCSSSAFGSGPYACADTNKALNETVAATQTKTTPKWKNPFDDMQITIPGLKKFSEPKPCADDSSKMCVNWIGEYIAGIYNYGINIVGILAAIVIMIGGVLWLLAGGNSSKIGEAKKWIGASIGGLVIALASYTILYQINPNLTIFKPLRITIVEEIQGEPLTSGGGLNNIPSDPIKRDQYDAYLKAAAKEFGVNCTYLKAILFTESSGDPKAKSGVGAVGLMQLMPDTAKGLGTFNLYDSKDNIRAGAAYVKKLISSACNGSKTNSVCTISDIKYITASYNGGPGCNKASENCPGQTWWECQQNPKYQQTRNYVNKIKANYDQLGNLGAGC